MTRTGRGRIDGCAAGSLDGGRTAEVRFCVIVVAAGARVKDEVDEVAKASPDARADESSVELGGYQQELKRTLGSFQVFAIS